jgi:hypothetical protein
VADDRMLILGVESYSFQDKQDPNRQVHVNRAHGCYIDGGGPSDRERGVLPVVLQADPNVLNSLRSLPGVYSCHTRVVQRGSRSQVCLVSAVLVEGLDFGVSEDAPRVKVA